MSRGLMMFTEGGDTLAGRITKYKRDEGELEIAYQYKLEGNDFIGSFKATSENGNLWTGEWSQRNQRWQSTSGSAELVLLEDKERCFLYGTWGDPIEGEKGRWTLEIELPRSYR